MRRRKLIRFWPVYYDRKKTRRMGRRVSKSMAFEKANTNTIVQAAKALGYYAEVDPNLRFPACWWEPQGCVMIDTQQKKKSKVLRQIASKMREQGTK